MNTLQRLLSNTFLAFVSHIIVKASNSILFIFIGRLLGPTEAGVFNLGVTYYTIVFSLSAWGLHELLVRELSSRREEGKRYLVNYLIIRVMLAAVMYGLLLLGLFAFTPYTAYTQTVIFVLALAVFPEAIFSICQALFEAYERLFPPSAVAFTSSLFKLSVGIWMVYQGYSAQAVAWIVPLGSTLGLLLFIPALIQLFRRIPSTADGRFEWRFSYDALRNTPDFFVIHIFSLLDYQTDAFLISLLLSEQHVGWYGAAQTTLLAFWMLPNAIRAAIYPLMARYHQAKSQNLAVLYKEVSRYLIVAILPMAAGVSLLAEPIIHLIFDDSFGPAVPTLRWSIWAVVFGTLNVPSARLLIIDNRQREAAWITGLSMVTNVVCNLLLIPLYGIVGAAIARLIASAVFATLIYVYAQVLVLKKNLLPLFWRPVVATALMSLIVWQLQSWGLIAAILGGIISYTVIIFAIGGLSAADRIYLQQLLYKTNHSTLGK